MESFPRLRTLGCVVCGDPVSPCPSPACPPELFGDVAPVVCRSVLLSSTHPQFTTQELESKLRTGEIERFQAYHPKNHAKIYEEQHSYGHHEHFPALVGKESMTGSRQRPSLQKTTPGFFSNLENLQRQLVSGHSKWSHPIGQQGEIKSSKTLSRSRFKMAQNTKLSNTAKYDLFPPILDVWAQHDAMQRSITLRI